MTQPKTDSSGKWFLLSVVAIFILGAFGVALAASRGGGDDLDNVAAVAAVEITGGELAPMPPGGGITSHNTDPAAGTKGPDLVGTDFQDQSVSIKADGRPKVVYFLAHWCPHCQEEVPQIVNMTNQGLKPDNVDFYAVSTAVDPSTPNYPPAKWLKEEKWPFPIIRDTRDSEAFTAYGAGGFPYAVYLDGDNNVLFRSSGELEPEVAAELWARTAASDVSQ